jgi:carboxyl-terminal processing protease
MPRTRGPASPATDLPDDAHGPRASLLSHPAALVVDGRGRSASRALRSVALAGVAAMVFTAGMVVGQAGQSGAVEAVDEAAASTSPVASHRPGGPGDVIPDGAPEDFGVFWEALELVKDRYVDPDRLGDENLTWGAIRGLVDALGDTGHTAFLTPDEVLAQSDQLTGRISGIGIMVDARAGVPLVISVFDGSPADEAGLRAGDLITSVDGQTTERMTVDEIIELVRGEAGTTVTLGIRHRDGSTEEVPIVRAEIEVSPVAWAFIPGTRIADIRLVQFSEGAADGTRDALKEAIDQGATGIVLDMRGNPGGLVHEAVAVASMFLKEGIVYQEEDRSGSRRTIATIDDPIAPDLPMTVLVDYGSASSAEIVAAALQDNDRARVVGQRTFGTGTVLNIFPLSDGSAIRLGVIEWLTPDGAGIFETGITPDVEVALPSDGSPMEPSELEDLTKREFREGGDAQLRRAVRELTDPSTLTPASPAPGANG